jgi:hypothetical protein
MATVAVLTATGRNEVTTAMQAGTVVGKVVAWGLNPSTITATAPDIGLYKESSEARTTGTASIVTTTTTNDTYQVTGTITASAGETIAEMGLFDSTTKPASTTWATAPTSTSGTTGTLTSGTGFASGAYAIDQDGEVMLLGTVSGTSVTVITRAANGSTAQTSANGNEITVGQIPGGSAVTGGACLMHASFTGLALNSGDSIAFTAQIKFT